MIHKNKKGEYEVHLLDFGFATFFNPKKGEDLQLGTPLYMAPEIINGDTYGDRVDIWSTGILTYIMLCGYPPFHAKGRAALFKKILESEPDFKGKCWKNISDEAIEFIKLMLEKDPEKRPSAKELLDHQWIKLHSLKSNNK
jgi:serine/threonine protein kinase